VIEAPEPTISLTKTGPSECEVGEEISYTITVTNTGNVPLSNVVVTDADLGWTGPAIGSLAPAASATYTLDHTFTAAGRFTNTAEVTGWYEDDDVSAEDSHTVTVTEAPDPAISLTKTGPSSSLVGDEITYVITVTNTGNIALWGVTVTDLTLGLDYSVGDLGVGESQQINVTYQTSSGDVPSLTNEALAVGHYDEEAAVEGTASWTVDVLTPTPFSPGLTITKTGPRSAYVGDRVRYTITVTNSGEEDLILVEVTDEVLGWSSSIGDLPAGESRTFTLSHRLSDSDRPSLTNTAVVTGIFRREIERGYYEDEELRAEAQHTVRVRREPPEEIFYVLSVFIAPDGGGEVNVNPDQPKYEPGTEVELEAVPADGWVFVGWRVDGDPFEGDEEIQITMDSDRVVEAIFKELEIIEEPQPEPEAGPEPLPETGGNPAVYTAVGSMLALLGAALRRRW